MAPEDIKKYFSELPEMLKPLFVDVDNFWEVLPGLSAFIKKKVTPKMEGIKVGDVYIDNDVSIGKGTVVEHGTMIKGPAIIGENCTIRSGAYIRGGVFIANNCVIGHSCEVKNSILMEEAHLGHFNYVGDSILGKKVILETEVFTVT